MFNSRTENSKDHWETPDKIFTILNREFKFTLDAAASDTNHKCQNYFTKENNGLIQDWQGHTIFVNPPYSEKNKWIEKAFEESKKPKTTVVMLLPVNASTKIWHKYIMQADEIRFVKGRINFEINGDKIGDSPNFASCIVVFNTNLRRFPKLSSFHYKTRDIIAEECNIEKWIYKPEKEKDEEKVMENILIFLLYMDLSQVTEHICYLWFTRKSILVPEANQWRLRKLHKVIESAQFQLDSLKDYYNLHQKSHELKTIKLKGLRKRLEKDTNTNKDLIQDYVPILEAAIRYWGSDPQINTFFEEMGELMQAINKYKRHRYTEKPENEPIQTLALEENIAEEIADLEIMLEQIKILFDFIPQKIEKRSKI